MNPRILREMIQTAEERLARAQETMEGVLGELEVLPRAQKMRISTTMETAFENVRAAQAELAKLERLL